MAKAKNSDSEDTSQLVDFETALAELETLVNQMESGDLSLDASLKAFERGIALTRQCQSALAEAELKIKVLTEDGELTEFTEEAAD
ncbi:MAG: exodeoxyribonuclease VII small subunit [Pseudomonadota bacterium]